MIRKHPYFRSKSKCSPVMPSQIAGNSINREVSRHPCWASHEVPWVQIDSDQFLLQLDGYYSAIKGLFGKSLKEITFAILWQSTFNLLFFTYMSYGDSKNWNEWPHLYHLHLSCTYLLLLRFLVQFKSDMIDNDNSHGPVIHSTSPFIHFNVKPRSKCLCFSFECPQHTWLSQACITRLF